ncbi:38223_t:CDS:1, partial [Gigaspora margarita]
DDPAVDTINNIANNMDTCSRPLIGCKVPKVVLKGLEFGIFIFKLKELAYKEATINLNSAQLPCLSKEGTYQYLVLIFKRL